LEALVRLRLLVPQQLPLPLHLASPSVERLLPSPPAVRLSPSAELRLLLHQALLLLHSALRLLRLRRRLGSVLAPPPQQRQPHLRVHSPSVEPLRLLQLPQRQRLVASPLEPPLPQAQPAPVDLVGSVPLPPLPPLLHQQVV
jgi:hypothetical protein